MSLYGHVRGVKQTTLGSNLAADVVLGATSIVLDDVLDFEVPETGYPLVLNMLEPESPLEPADGDISLLSYTALDEDTATLTLENPTETTYLSGGRVEVYPRVTLRHARVALDDAEEEATGVRALVPHALYDRLLLGPRETTQEAVEIEDTGSDYIVTNVRGKEPAADGTYLLDGSVEAKKLLVSALSAITANIGKVTAGEIVGALISTNDNPNQARVTLKDTAGEPDRIKFYNAAGLQGHIRAGLGTAGLVLEPQGGTRVVIQKNALEFSDPGVSNASPNITSGTGHAVPANATQYIKVIGAAGRELWIPGFT